MADNSAETVTRATISAMKNLPQEKVKTMTFDNGKEFAGFKELERGLEIRSYYSGFISSSIKKGMVKKKVEPWPGWDSTHTRPLCRSRIRLTMESPIPLPS